MQGSISLPRLAVVGDDRVEENGTEDNGVEDDRKG